MNWCDPAQELTDRFDKYGRVKEVRIVRNPQNGESRGFGFVVMEDREGVDRVSAQRLYRV